MYKGGAGICFCDHLRNLPETLYVLAHLREVLQVRMGSQNSAGLCVKTLLGGVVGLARTFWRNLLLILNS